MSDSLYLVFSGPPEGVSAEEYDRWYDRHLRENIQSPGFVSGRRFALEPSGRGADGQPPFSHLALYEYDGEMSRWRTSLNERIEAGEIYLPEWFTRIQFGSWDCKPLGPRLEPGA